MYTFAFCHLGKQLLQWCRLFILFREKTAPSALSQLRKILCSIRMCCLLWISIFFCFSLYTSSVYNQNYTPYFFSNWISFLVLAVCNLFWPQQIFSMRLDALPCVHKSALFICNFTSLCSVFLCMSFYMC